MTSIDVLREIMQTHSQDTVRVVRHTVGENHRQRYPTEIEQRLQWREGLRHDMPSKMLWLRPGDFAAMANAVPEEGVAWSVASSRVPGEWHLPLMNFHPVPGFSLVELREAICSIAPDRQGWLLDSGRYHHYYGNYLIAHEDWPAWMAQFLVPLVLVSSRYIAHRLHHGYATLRVTADTRYKPHVPVVIERLPGSTREWKPV